MQRQVHLFSVRRQLCIGDGDDNYLLGSHSGRHHNPLHQKLALI